MREDEITIIVELGQLMCYCEITSDGPWLKLYIPFLKGSYLAIIEISLKAKSKELYSELLSLKKFTSQPTSQQTIFNKAFRFQG